MEEAVIEAELRGETGSRASRRLRKSGRVPGVVYGHGQEGVNVFMNAHDLLKSLHSGAHIFDLKLKGQPDDKVLIKEVQYDSLGNEIIHVDLQRVALTETVEVTVPIMLVGHAIGAVHKGIVDQPLKELEVACLPTQIPDDVRVHVTELDIGDMLTVKDIDLPEGVSTLNAPDQVVVTVHPPVKEEEVEAAVEAGEEVEPAEPEVIGAAPREEEPPEGEVASGGPGRGGKPTK